MKTPPFLLVIFFFSTALFTFSCKHNPSEPDITPPSETESSDSKFPDKIIPVSISNDSSIPNSEDVYIWNNSYIPNQPTRNIIISSEMGDSINSITFEDECYLNLSDSFSWTQITGVDVTATSSDGLITIETPNEKNLKITITGTASGNSILIKSNSNNYVYVVFDNVTLTSANYPILEMDSKSKLFISFEGTNNLTDIRTYGTGYSKKEGKKYYTKSYTGDKTDIELTRKWEKGSDTKGSIYSKGPMILVGSGTVKLNEGYKHAFYSKDYIRIVNGTFEVNTNGRNAFQSVNGFIMDNGSVTIYGTGSYTNNESRGIIVEGDESKNTPGEGFIVINDGTLNITTTSKAISAKWDITEDATTTETSDDPYPYTLINGGTININTTMQRIENGPKTTFFDADGITVTESTKLSPEGIEGKQSIYIKGGNIIINSMDDAISASRADSEYGSSLVISGGTIYACCNSNDSIDSNGTISITGGTVISYSKTNESFDCDGHNFTITGGTVAGISYKNFSSPAPNSCQNQGSIIIEGYVYAANDNNFVITKSDGKPVYALEIPTSIFGTTSDLDYTLVVSSPSLQDNQKYSIIRGSTFTNGSKYNGLYTVMPSITGGTILISDISFSTNWVYKGLMSN